MTRTDMKPPVCCTHHAPMVWSEEDYAFEDDGVQVVVHNVAAFRCPQGDDIAFTPGVSDQLLRIIRELMAAVKRTREASAIFGRYEISVTRPAVPVG